MTARRGLRLVAGVALAASAVVVPPARAAESSPFDIVTGIVGWFDRLNSQWGKIVDREQRAQFVRAIDRLRRDLYRLEGDTRLLRASLPDAPPDGVELQSLQDQITALRATVEALRATAKALGAEIGISDAEAARLVDRSLISRAVTLDYLSRALIRDGEWRPGDLRRRLDAALALLVEAQTRVTTVRNRLAVARG